jgi:putative transposase
VQNPKKPAGRKPPGYSLNNQGEKISDELIKEYLLELVCGDGFLRL